MFPGCNQDTGKLCEHETIAVHPVRPAVPCRSPLSHIVRDMLAKHRVLLNELELFPKSDGCYRVLLGQANAEYSST